MYKLEGIPDSEVDRVIKDISLDGSRLVSKFKAADGTWTLVIAPPGLAAADVLEAAATDTGDQIAWGAKTETLYGPAFKARVFELCGNLKIDPNYLMAVMAFESGRSFLPDKVNAAGSKAVGLIQFMPNTAKSLGTSSSALAQMSAIEQLAYVEAYFKQWTTTKTLKTLSDVYMAVLLPKAIGKPESYVLFAAGTKAYTQNAGLDVNDDGKVTKAEASHKVQLALTEGMRTENLG